MNMNILEMDQSAARKAFLEYRNAIRAHHSEEDAQIMRCYRELSQGRRLIDLPETIKTGGVHDSGLPKLAIMRADQSFCYCTNGGGDITFAFARTWSSRNKAGIYTFPGMFSRGHSARGRSVVPVIPPALRPPHALSNYLILWEAEWTRVPVDPALLKHIGGTLYAVLATWDLTEVERAVLALRPLPKLPSW